METLVFFTITGTEICGGLHSSADVRPEARLPLAAQLDHMHLIDETTGEGGVRQVAVAAPSPATY